MRIVHFTHKTRDARALRPAFHAHLHHGHEVIFVQRSDNFVGNDVVLRARGEPLYDTFPHYVIGGSSGVAIAKKIHETFAPDVVHCHEMDQMFMLVSHGDDSAKEKMLLDERPLWECRFDLVHPPFPVVYDMHEDELGMGTFYVDNTASQANKRWIEKEMVHRADAIIVCSQRLCERIMIRYPHTRDIFTVNNAPPKQRRAPHRGKALAHFGYPPRSDKPIVGFAGMASVERKVHQLCVAVSRLDWPFFTVGSIFEDHSEIAISIAGAGGKMIPHQQYPHQGMDKDLNLLDVLSMADVGYCAGDLDIPNWQVGLPNKLFEYLFSNVPVAAMNMPDVVRYLETYGLGLRFDGTPRDLIAKLPEVAELGRKAKQSGGFVAFQKDVNFDVLGGPNCMRAYETAREVFR